jgi:hypothetical protein
LSDALLEQATSPVTLRACIDTSHVSGIGRRQSLNSAGRSGIRWMSDSDSYAKGIAGETRAVPLNRAARVGRITDSSLVGGKCRLSAPRSYLFIARPMTIFQRNFNTGLVRPSALRLLHD